MRFVIQLDFSTSAVDLELGETKFENDLTRLYIAVEARAVWSKQGPTGRTDFVLCDGPGPRELTSIAKRIYEAVSVRPVFLPEKQSEPLFGF